MPKSNSISVNRSVEDEQCGLHKLFMQTPAAIAILRGKEHIFEFANPLYLELIGQSDRIIGMAANDVFPEVAEQRFIKLLDDIFSTGELYVDKEIPLELNKKDNSGKINKFFNFVYQPTADADGNVEHIIVHASDVTDQVMARQEAEGDREQYRSLFNSIDQSFCVIEVIFDKNKIPIDYRFLETNAVFEEQSGLKNVIGKTIRELVPDYEKRWINMYGRVALTGEPIRIEDWTAALSRWYDVYAMRVGGDESHKVTVLFTDITKRRHAEEALKASEARFRDISDNATTGLLIMDRQQHCTFMNPAAEKIIGYTMKSMAMTNRPLHDLIHHTKSDGSHYSLKECPIVNVLNEKNKSSGEEIFFRPDGTQYPVAFSASPIITEGTIAGTVIEVRDISEEKQARMEQQRLVHMTEQRNELLKLNKAKDEFIALASHQLRTPATAVKQYISLLMEGYAGPVPVEQIQYLQTAYDSNEREISIINDLLKTAQLDSEGYELRKKNYDVGEIIQEIINEYQPVFELKNQSAILKKNKTPVIASVDRKEIKLVLINLIENASKYSHPDTEIKISIRQKANCVDISIADNGVGISEDSIEKVFEKFTRVDNELSDTVSGSGLGLYWVKQIVELHGGSINLVSQTGKGSTFTIRLPL